MKIKEKPEDFKVFEIPNLNLTPKGRYWIYRLTKKNRNTEDVIQELCAKTNLSRKSIRYSGTKDKVAVTEQYISSQKEIKIKDLELRNATLEYAGKSNSEINLGDHEGNRFEIVVKEAGEPKQISRIKNYFGEQRFSRNNAEVGKEIVKGNFEKAAKMIDNRSVKEAMEKNPTDPIAAIKTLPEKIASIYIHAYQSKLWNEAAEKLEGEIMLPLIGYGTKFSSPEVKKVYKEIMKPEGITPRNFVIRTIPYLSAEGGERPLYVSLENLKIEEDTVSFSLPSGSYATEALKQIFSQ